MMIEGMFHFLIFPRFFKLDLNLWAYTCKYNHHRWPDETILYWGGLKKTQRCVWCDEVTERMTRCPNCTMPMVKGILNLERTIEWVGSRLKNNFQQLKAATTNLKGKAWVNAFQCAKCQITLTNIPARKNLVPKWQKLPASDVEMYSELR